MGRVLIILGFPAVVVFAETSRAPDPAADVALAADDAAAADEENDDFCVDDVSALVAVDDPTAIQLPEALHCVV